MCKYSGSSEKESLIWTDDVFQISNISTWKKNFLETKTVAAKISILERNGTYSSLRLIDKNWWNVTLKVEDSSNVKCEQCDQ